MDEMAPYSDAARAGTVCSSVDGDAGIGTNHHGRHAIGAAHIGSDHEFRRDHQYSRLHDLRHTFGHGRQLQDPAADGGVEGLARWEDLYVHPSRWAQVARWNAR